MMSSSKVRVALVGLDHWYSAFPLAESVVAHPDTELVGIADAELGRAQELGRRVGVERVTDDLEELVRDDLVDLVASFVSVDRNPSICVAAAQAGKAILSVKPVARTLDEATEVLRAVREAGVHFIPAECRQRLSKQNAQLHDWVSQGRLGQLLTASFSMWASLPQKWPGDSDPGWFADPARAPGGGWVDHSIYHIDLLRWLLQDEVARVSGRAGNLKHHDLPVEDYGTATVEFGNGLIATIEDTWHGAPGAFRVSMTLVGASGALAYDTLSGRLSVAGDFPPFSGWVHTTPPDRSGDDAGHLAAVVRGEAEPAGTIEDAWRNLAACRAFYGAAESGTAVEPARLPE